jgi:hypothetical protein
VHPSSWMGQLRAEGRADSAGCADYDCTLDVQSHRQAVRPTSRISIANIRAAPW